MQNADPHFLHLSQDAREEVFERLNKALNELATYIPSARQNPYWKTRVVNQFWRKWEWWSFMNGWTEDYDFPFIEECFESVVEELGILAQVALLDPRLQIEVVPFSSNGFPVWAIFPIDQQKWVKECIEVRPATEILLVLFQPDFEHLLKDEAARLLRHELGHVLVHLREPEARDECPAAEDAWKRGTQMEDFIG